MKPRAEHDSLAPHRKREGSELIDRRALLVGLAAVAGAALIHRPGSAAALDPIDHLRREYEWAARGLLAALDSGDFEPWQPGTQEAKPFRWRLARAYVMSRELDQADPYGGAVAETLADLWHRLNRPQDHHAV